MKTIVAVSYSEMEEYLSGIEYIEVVDIPKNKNQLIESCRALRPGLVITSSTLHGDENIKEVLYVLTAKEFDGMKIIYLCGEEDEDTQYLCSYLKGIGITELLIGSNISTDELDNVICRTVYGEQAGKALKSKKVQRSNTNKYLKSKLKDLFSTIIGGGRKQVIIENVLKHLCIAIYSNHTTGKSHTAWNLAQAIADRGYTATLINLDKGYSANLYFGIDEIYYDLLQYEINEGLHKDILNNCFKNGNLNIIAGKLGDSVSIGVEDFEKLLYYIRTKSDITIIDTASSYDELTRAAIKSSNVDLLIFDCDLMHLNSNKLLIDEMDESFIAEKTISIINNCDVRSEAYKFIYNQIKKMKFAFQAIIPLSSCGLISCELMHTKHTPYKVRNRETISFSEDLDRLLDLLNIGYKG